MAASTRPPLVKTLPTPTCPPSVLRMTRAWTESSGLISLDHPPFGDFPDKGTASTETIFRGLFPSAAGMAHVTGHLPGNVLAGIVEIMSLGLAGYGRADRFVDRAVVGVRAQ